MYYLVLIIISLIVAWILQSRFKTKDISGGYWNQLLGALIGCWLGDLILGDWLLMLAGFNVLAGIIGSLLVGWVYLMIFSRKEPTDISN